MILLVKIFTFYCGAVEATSGHETLRARVVIRDVAASSDRRELVNPHDRSPQRQAV